MLRIVESAVMKVYRFFFADDDIKVNLARRSKELPETAKNNSEEDEDGGGERRPKVVSHSWWQRRKERGHCFVEVFRGEIPRMQQNELAVFSW